MQALPRSIFQTQFSSIRIISTAFKGASFHNTRYNNIGTRTMASATSVYDFKPLDSSYPFCIPHIASPLVFLCFFIFYFLFFGSMTSIVVIIPPQFSEPPVPFVPRHHHHRLHRTLTQIPLQRKANQSHWKITKAKSSSS